MDDETMSQRSFIVFIHSTCLLTKIFNISARTVVDMENMANLSLTVTDMIQTKSDEEAVISILTKVLLMMMMMMMIMVVIMIMTMMWWWL